MMGNLLRKAWLGRWVLRSLPQSIWFNFHYLPFKQAIKLPIFLYKPVFIKCRGRLIVDSPHVKTGMILLGNNVVTNYPFSGIHLEINEESTITFKGRCMIGNNSGLTVRSKGSLVFGDGFLATTTLRIECLHPYRVR